MKTVNFTSISNLRESSAMQSRVTQVENNLRKINPAWDRDWFFPAYAVGLSNALEDVSWVCDAKSVLLELGDLNMLQNGSLPPFSATEFIGKMDQIKETSVTSRANAESLLRSVDAALSILTGNQTASWKDGLQVLATTANTVSSAAFSVRPETESTGSNEADTSTADVAYNALASMDVADVLAVVLRVNAAKGALLKGSTTEEQQHFISALTGEEVKTSHPLV